MQAAGSIVQQYQKKLITTPIWIKNLTGQCKIHTRWISRASADSTRRASFANLANSLFPSIPFCSSAESCRDIIQTHEDITHNFQCTVPKSICCAASTRILERWPLTETRTCSTSVTKTVYNHPHNNKEDLHFATWTQSPPPLLLRCCTCPQQVLKRPGDVWLWSLSPQSQRFSNDSQKKRWTKRLSSHRLYDTPVNGQ